MPANPRHPDDRPDVLSGTLEAKLSAHRTDTSADAASAVAALGALRLVDVACGYTLLGQPPIGFCAFGITRDRTLATRPVESSSSAQTKVHRVVTDLRVRAVPSWLLAHLNVRDDEDWTMLGFESQHRKHWWAIDAAAHPSFVERFLDIATLYRPGEPLRVKLAM